MTKVGSTVLLLGSLIIDDRQRDLVLLLYDFSLIILACF